MKKSYYTFESPRQQHVSARNRRSWTDIHGVKRTVAELSDSHLLHVIGFLESNSEEGHCNDNLNFMLNEARYRYEEEIFVGEYKQTQEGRTESIPVKFTLVELLEFLNCHKN